MYALNATIGEKGNGEFSVYGDGMVTIGSQRTIATETLVVGAYGPGTYNQNSGSTTVYGDLVVGQGANGNGRYEMNEPPPDPYYYQAPTTLSVNGMLKVGNASTAKGSFIQNGGSVTVTQDTILAAASEDNGKSEFYFSGGTFTTRDLLIGERTGITGTYSQSGGDATANNMTIANGSKATLSGGTIKVNNALINEGALTLSAGGLLTVGNTFTSSGTLGIDLNAYNGKSFITLLNSTADLDGTLQITGTSSLNTEMTFTLISAAHGFSQASDLTFTYLDLPEISGFHWEYGLSQLGTAYLLSLKSGQSPVPVPSSILLLGSGLVLLARRRRHPTLQ